MGRANVSRNRPAAMAGTLAPETGLATRPAGASCFPGEMPGWGGSMVWKITVAQTTDGWGHKARVWASRPSVVAVATVRDERTDNGYGQERRCAEVEVRLLPGFDPAKDFLVVEEVYTSDVHHTHHHEYKLLAGTMPRWASFPAAWKEWVGRWSSAAADWLLERAEDDDQRWAVKYAQRKVSQSNRRRAWADVALVFGVNPPLPADSWTAVAAMPIRIARQLGWRAPEPPPRWEDATKARRVLVAGFGRGELPPAAEPAEATA
jgi:hypothetical protein